MPDAQSDVSRMVDRRMALAREWDELVEQVRQLEGFEDFLRPPKLETLLPAAANGPVAVINISQWRCDALIVTIDGVHVEELPQLSAEIVAEKAGDYLRVLQQVDRAAHELYAAWQRYDSGDHGFDAVRQFTEAKRAVQDADRDRDQTLAAVLAWLWDEIADPVLTRLGLVSPPHPASHGPGCGGARPGSLRCCRCTPPGTTTRTARLQPTRHRQHERSWGRSSRVSWSAPKTPATTRRARSTTR